MKNKQVEGYIFICLHPLYRYSLAFYYDEKHLAIELDGNVHIERFDYDEYRDDFMRILGIKTLRFDNDDIMNNIDSVLDMIKRELSEKA